MIQRFVVAALVMLLATSLPEQVLCQSNAPTDSPAPSPTPSLSPSKEGPPPTESPAPSPTPSLSPTRKDQFPTESPAPSPTPSQSPSKVGDPPVSSPPVAPTPIECGEFPPDGCRICGPGKCMTIPDAIFMAPGEPDVPCGQLEEAGRQKSIAPTLCSQLPVLVADQCGCELESNLVFTPAPVPPPSPAPSPASQEQQDCGYFDNVLCNVCGPGKCVTLPDAVLNIPGQPQYLCGALEEAGRVGAIVEFDCSFLPDWTTEPCGCAPPTAPTTTIPPTNAPVPPSTAPIPTASPVDGDDKIDFPFDGTEESTENDETLGGGAIFGIIFAACCVFAVGGFLAYKALQENNIRQTHDRGLTLDPTSTPTKAVPPLSLFMSSPGVDDGANFAADDDLASGDPQDGPMESVPVEII